MKLALHTTLYLSRLKEEASSEAVGFDSGLVGDPLHMLPPSSPLAEDGLWGREYHMVTVTSGGRWWRWWRRWSERGAYGGAQVTRRRMDIGRRESWFM